MSDQLAHEFINTLNRHGYAFQFAVLNEARRLRESGRSAFDFEVSEFPVQVRGASTRIDFVLKKREGPLRLVAECKRANPALFGRRSSVTTDLLSAHLWIDSFDTVAKSFTSNNQPRLSPTTRTISLLK